jgi:hypothetical protein
MPQSHSLPERVNIYIQRPTCPKCHAQMMLARITPHSVGFDLRMFEGPRCEHVHESIVETGAFGRP